MSVIEASNRSHVVESPNPVRTSVVEKLFRRIITAQFREERKLDATMNKFVEVATEANDNRREAWDRTIRVFTGNILRRRNNPKRKK